MSYFVLQIWAQTSVDLFSIFKHLFCWNYPICNCRLLYLPWLKSFCFHLYRYFISTQDSPQKRHVYRWEIIPKRSPHQEMRMLYVENILLNNTRHFSCILVAVSPIQLQCILPHPYCMDIIHCWNAIISRMRRSASTNQHKNPSFSASTIGLFSQRCLTCEMNQEACAFFDADISPNKQHVILQCKGTSLVCVFPSGNHSEKYSFMWIYYSHCSKTQPILGNVWDMVRE